MTGSPSDLWYSKTDFVPVELLYGTVTPHLGGELKLFQSFFCVFWRSWAASQDGLCYVASRPVRSQLSSEDQGCGSRHLQPVATLLNGRQWTLLKCAHAPRWRCWVHVGTGVHCTPSLNWGPTSQNLCQPEQVSEPAPPTDLLDPRKTTTLLSLHLFAPVMGAVSRRTNPRDKTKTCFRNCL